MVFTSPAPTHKTETPVSRKSYAKLPYVLDVPNLIKIQIDSFQRFKEDAIGVAYAVGNNTDNEAGGDYNPAIVQPLFFHPSFTTSTIKRKRLHLGFPFSTRNEAS